MSDYIKKIRTDDGDKQIDYNALANKPTIEQIYNSEITINTSDTGKSISITDSLDGKIKGLSVYGESSQEETISLSEENLLPPTFDGISNNMPWVDETAIITNNDDGTLTIHGTITHGTPNYFWFWKDMNYCGEASSQDTTLPTGKYFISGYTGNPYVSFIWDGSAIPAEGKVIDITDSTATHGFYLSVIASWDDNGNYIESYTFDNLVVTPKIQKCEIGPSPEVPTEIFSIVNPTITISDLDDNEQIITLEGYELKGLKRGNTWIARDEIVYKDGKVKLIKRVAEQNFDELIFVTAGSNNGYLRVNSTRNFGGSNNACLCTIFPYVQGLWAPYSKEAISNSTSSSRLYITISEQRLIDSGYTVDSTGATAWLKASGGKVYYNLATPTEEDITDTVLAKVKDLKTYNPTTTVESNADTCLIYCADTQKYIDNKFNELKNAIISLGGNV